MIKTERFYEILKQFKQEFAGEHWHNEKYKWECAFAGIMRPCMREIVNNFVFQHKF